MVDKSDAERVLDMSETGIGQTTAASGVGDINTHPFQFNGTGKEFFGIWIVNILLTIITLGIYSAWAKVRTKRYFNGNTQLASHSFDYHANPVAILKGRIIVVVVLVVLNLLSQINPLLAIGVLVFYAIALPWVIVRGLKFNANMTSYRNVRFHFEGTKWDAFKAYILWPLLATVTFGAFAPYASRANARFLGDGHSFGSSTFAADPPLKPYYKALGLSSVLIVVPLILVAIMGGITYSTSIDPDLVLTMLPVIIGVVYFGFIVAFLIYAAHSRNIGFNNLHLREGHRFTSTVTVKSFLWILITNFLLIIVTIGLYIPWAKVRLARYLADNTTMLAKGDLDRFTDEQIEGRGVASGEFLDIEGIDFGF